MSWISRLHSSGCALVLAASVIAGGGCTDTERVETSDYRSPAMPVAAQAKLPTQKLFVGPREVDAEVAASELQIRTGMMFRKSIADQEGMIFIFGAPHQPSFWMKNVPINLAVAYIDGAGVIREIHPLIAQREEPVLSARQDIQFVLEMAEGWFKRHGVEVGTVITTPRGSLRQTFLGAR